MTECFLSFFVFLSHIFSHKNLSIIDAIHPLPTTAQADRRGSFAFNPMSMTLMLVQNHFYAGRRWHRLECHVDTTGGTLFQAKLSARGQSPRIRQLVCVTCRPLFSLIGGPFLSVVSSAMWDQWTWNLLFVQYTKLGIKPLTADLGERSTLHRVYISFVWRHGNKSTTFMSWIMMQFSGFGKKQRDSVNVS